VAVLRDRAEKSCVATTVETRYGLRMKLAKIASLVLSAGILLAGPALSQSLRPVPRPLAPGYQTIREETLRADLTFLASDALEGRMSLETGDETAIQWIASEFAKAGLAPAANGSYLQPVPLIEYRPDRAQNFVALARTGKETQWKFPEVLGGYRQDVDLTAEVVFAGFGITAPELGYDDYAPVDAHGKIVLLFDHEPQENDAASIFNGTGNTRYATTRVKVLNAQAHGAVGVLIVAEPNRKHPSNQERVARIGGSAARPTPLPSQALGDDELHIPAAIVSDAAAKEILASAGRTPSELQSAIDRDLKPQARALPYTRATIHFRNTSVKTGTSYNVVGLLEGADAKLKSETVLVSGHHDHDGMSGSEIWHGADDNGSGSVGVVQLAHAFATNAKARSGLAPKRSILFVVFAAEERGLLGSFYLAAHPVRPLASTRAMINFDMIGRKRGSERSDHRSARNPRRYQQPSQSHRRPLQPRLSPYGRRAKQTRGLGPRRPLRSRIRTQRFLPQRPVSLRSQEYSRFLVVYGISSRLSPHHRHRRQDQLRKNGQDSASCLSHWLSVRKRSDTAALCRQSGFQPVGSLMAGVTAIPLREPNDPLAQSLPFEHLHCDIGAALEFSDLIDGADVGMIERGSGARLALEALGSLAVVCEHIRQEFQGHTPAKTQVFGLADFTHSAAAETAQNSIM